MPNVCIEFAAKPSGRVVVAEAGGWSTFIPGLPVAAEGAKLEEAIAALARALREYSADWAERLRVAPNHVHNRPLVQLIALSDDQQLTEWLTT